ncbi:hypothetical protein QFZ68_005745 [Streptomyces sp. V1I6]|nr:hypothetical protein [Streptomyces sp. V1I6]
MDRLRDRAAVGRLLQGLLHLFAQLDVQLAQAGLFRLRRSPISRRCPLPLSGKAIGSRMFGSSARDMAHSPAPAASAWIRPAASRLSLRGAGGRGLSADYPPVPRLSQSAAWAMVARAVSQPPIAASSAPPSMCAVPGARSPLGRPVGLVRVAQRGTAAEKEPVRGVGGPPGDGGEGVRSDRDSAGGQGQDVRQRATPALRRGSGRRRNRSFPSKAMETTTTAAATMKSTRREAEW